MSEPDLNELRELSEAAKQVLGNSAFNAAFNELNQAYWQQFVASEGEAKGARELLYAKAQYGQEFLKTMQLILNRYEAALLQQQNSELPSM